MVNRSSVLYSAVSILFFLLIAVAPSAAMKNRKATFPDPCDAVWRAVMTVAKTQEYRVVSVSTEEQIVSVAAGGVWWGERLMSATLAPAKERGCVLTLQSRFSGLIHSDGPDFIARVNIELIGVDVDHDSKEFKRFRDCIDAYNSNETKCVDRFRATIENSGAQKGATSQSADPKSLANGPLSTAEKGSIGAWCDEEPRIRHDGVRIDRIAPDGPADQAGLRIGDDILALDGIYLFTVEELMNKMHRYNPGTKVSLRYRRRSTIYDSFVIMGAEEAQKTAIKAVD